MILDKQKLQTALEKRESTYLPLSLHIFDTVSSTNRVVWDLLAQGASAGCTVIASQQTAGRGQWGRKWISPNGGLYLSLGLAPKLQVADGNQLTLASAWGIAHQLRKCGINVGIKWLNDLVLDGRKLGGILTETKISDFEITQAVIGVGINWSNQVPATGINLRTWQTENKVTPSISLESLAAQVLIGIESGIQSLLTEGVNIILSGYTELLVNVGDRLSVNNLWGQIVGVTSTGNLRIHTLIDDTKSVKTPEIYLQPGTISLGYRKF